jgi:hypothetical protein
MYVTEFLKLFFPYRYLLLITRGNYCRIYSTGVSEAVPRSFIKVQGSLKSNRSNVFTLSLEQLILNPIRT